MARRARITEERRTVGVDVTREHARLERREIEPRPARPDELERAFVERSVRVPLMGQKAVARKELQVKGEVTIQRRPAAGPEPEPEPAPAPAEPVAGPLEAVEPRESVGVTGTAEAAAAVEVAGVRAEPAEAAVPDDAGERAETAAEAAERIAPVERAMRWFEEVRAGWTRARSAARTD